MTIAASRCRRWAWAGTLALVVAAPGPAVPQAQACGWDWETYHAEATSLPCVFDALLGYWPKHTDDYHRARIEAADHALRWVPGWTEGLDAKGISLLKLGRLPEAEAVMQQRLALAPEAYPGHANLGTLYTFTGDHTKALEHIDRAMAIEPKAHFGREKYHRALVVFLQRAAEDPKVASSENFLGIELSTHQRRKGSAEVFRTLSLDDDAFDALVSMLTVYGADGLAEVYLTLGELLAARGHPRLAYTAYRRAKELRHVRTPELKKWMKQLAEDIAVEHRSERASGVGGPFARLGTSALIGAYMGMNELYASKRREAKAFAKRWAAWEAKQVAQGLHVWTQAGLDEIYARMHAKRRRCDVPRIISDGKAPLAQADGTEPEEEEGAP
jgi:tetratricopeptide (TPR) repeat protein